MFNKNFTNHIDIIIPAYNAATTIKYTLASIYMQTIRDNLHVIVVDDCSDASADYDVTIGYYKKLGLDIQKIRLPENGGPGVARQKGIEAGQSEFFTCIDADDTFTSAIALETMREGMKQMNPQFPADSIKCASASFLQLGEDVTQNVLHQNDIKEIA